MVIGGHFGGGDHLDGGDHFGGGACRNVSLVNANFSVNQMCPIICRWKLVKHHYCFGDKRRTKDNTKIKLCGLNECCVT